MYNIRIIKKQLHFKQPAGTSRGVYTTRDLWYIVLTDTDRPGRYGVGECAPLPQLSQELGPTYEQLLDESCRKLTEEGKLDHAWLAPLPSIRFGLETALLHLEAGNLCFWQTPFSQGAAGIPINGLIWMGDFDTMRRRINEKLEKGFRCIKLKIGAIGFDQELELLDYIRRRAAPEQVELRVDANGAFTPEEAPEKLERLARYRLHSIEQPIRAGQWKEMGRLCRHTPLPVALDEELIGVNLYHEKMELLDTVRPQHIVLKPSLHGGIQGCKEWIGLAEERGIGWWVTSALESNIGLHSIAQWCATLQTVRTQGLGTGLLFTDNVDYPLHIQGDCLYFQPEMPAPDLLNWLEA